MNVHDLARIYGAGTGSRTVPLIPSREGRGVQVFEVTDRVMATIPPGMRDGSNLSLTHCNPFYCRLKMK